MDTVPNTSVVFDFVELSKETSCTTSGRQGSKMSQAPKLYLQSNLLNQQFSLEGYKSPLTRKRNARSPVTSSKILHLPVRSPWHYRASLLKRRHGDSHISSRICKSLKTTQKQWRDQPKLWKSSNLKWNFMNAQKKRRLVCSCKINEQPRFQIPLKEKFMTGHERSSILPSRVWEASNVSCDVSSPPSPRRKRAWLLLWLFSTSCKKAGSDPLPSSSSSSRAPGDQGLHGLFPNPSLPVRRCSSCRAPSCWPPPRTAATAFPAWVSHRGGRWRVLAASVVIFLAK